MGKIRIAGVVKHSLVNGPGVRFVLFTQGCPHFCHGCHNPETWEMAGGEVWDTDDIVKQVRTAGYLDGFTFSGGDPLVQSGECLAIARALREDEINLWLYTGYDFEEVLAGGAGEEAVRLMDYLDVVVDGRFDLSKKVKGDECIYRGSANQRLVDVQRSLSTGTIVLYEP